MNLLRPSSNMEAFGPERRWPRHDGCCGICGEYEGFHPRCWWYWLTEERVIRGGWDGEQQTDPDEPYPSRLWIARNVTLSVFDPHLWRLCWEERMWPWQL